MESLIPLVSRVGLGDTHVPMIRISYKEGKNHGSLWTKRGLLIIVILILERFFLPPILVTLQGPTNKDGPRTVATNHARNGSAWFSISLLSNMLPSPPLAMSSSHRKSNDEISRHSNTTVKVLPINDVTELPLADQIDYYFNDTSMIANQTTFQWLQSYLHWHHRIRTEYPDQQLFLDNDHNTTAPKLVIVYFDPNTHRNGLADRMRDLDKLLEFASREQRVLLFKWYQAPLPLETFLVPHLLNFTVPDHPTTITPERLKATYARGSPSTSQLDRVIHLPFEIDRMYSDQYRIYWHALFRPSPAVQARIDATMQSLHLLPGEFDATHLRVTHPAFRQQDMATYRATGGVALDEGNQYKLEGTDRTMALQGAIHAIQCTEWVAQRLGFVNKTNHPTTTQQQQQRQRQKIFFYGDSPELIKAVLHPDTLVGVVDDNETQLVEELQTIRSSMDLVGHQDPQVAHLQNRNENSTDAFLSTFVDLYIASYARCLGLGAGRFAFLAGKISGTTCWTRYLDIDKKIGGEWGLWAVKREVPLCEMAMSVGQ